MKIFNTAPLKWKQRRALKHKTDARCAGWLYRLVVETPFGISFWQRKSKRFTVQVDERSFISKP